MNLESPLDRLSEINCRLRGLLESLSCDSSTPSPQQLTALLADLLEIGSYLQEESIRQDIEEQAAAVRDYQKLLTELQHMMPELQARFLAQRALLERERHHLAVVASWSESARYTAYFK